MKRCRLFLTVVAAALFALSVSAGAALIPVDNPGFEDSTLGEDGWDWSLDNQGWGYYNNGGNIGSWNPTAGSYPWAVRCLSG